MIRKLATAGAILAACSVPAHSEISDGVVRIGMLSDLSSVFAATSGPGAIAAARMAAEDFMKTSPIKVEIISADHQNKPDVASNIVRRWFDNEKVDAVADLSNSGIALAVAQLGKENRKAILVTSSASNRITGKDCTPTMINWTFENFAVANGTARAMVDAGVKKWFFLTVDYTFGHELEQLTRNYLAAHGAEAVGGVKYPFGTADFSSFLVQAQASKADVVAIIGGGADQTNAQKQAREFALQKTMKIALLGATSIDINNLGPAAAEGNYLLDMFYWDRDEGTRAWTKRFAERHNNGNPPTMMHAGAYAGVLHYLKAVASVNSDDGVEAVAAMKKLRTDDPLFGKGYIRSDGRKVHDAYLFQAKGPSESKYRWDILKLVRTIPGEEAFLPLKDSECPLK